MCGIAGIDRNRGPLAGARLEPILASIRHRGPDDEGTWSDSKWRIGMRRLAIIDVARGQQPMTSTDGRWTIVMNGEIYNFQDLRAELTSRGASFRTNSDTEAVLEKIARDGFVATLEAAEGMFAIAAVDSLNDNLLLGRDRFGEKPLYIDRREGGFAFCSELTPLLSFSPAAHRVSARGIAAILRYGYPWPGVTAIEGISEVLPGHWLRRGKDGFEESGRYWEPPDRVDGQTEQHCQRRVLELLEASVSRRLVSDVPIGLFLSGGIDSGAVAAAAVRTRKDIRAVTVGFSASKYDERPLARLTAQYLGISLEEGTGDAAPFSPEHFDEYLRHYGQPFLDTSAIPTRAVSREARRHFTVVLSGDGGDELFSGYLPQMRAIKLRRFGGGQLGGRLSRWVSSILPKSGIWESAQRALDLNAAFADGLLIHEMEGVFTDTSLLRLFEGTAWEHDCREHLESAREEAHEIWRTVKDSNLALSLQQIRHSMPQDILTKVDRMSMANSLEVRAPFLDSKLATYALAMPAHLKVRANQGKYVLRQALREWLPKAVLTAPKRGFSLPVREWLGDGFWRELQQEANAYAEDSSAELNVHAVKTQVAADRERCRNANSYRALHRAVLLYGFLRWRRTQLGLGKASETAAGVNAHV